MCGALSRLSGMSFPFPSLFFNVICFPSNNQFASSSFVFLSPQIIVIVIIFFPEFLESVTDVCPCSFTRCRFGTIL